MTRRTHVERYATGQVSLRAPANPGLKATVASKGLQRPAQITKLNKLVNEDWTKAMNDMSLNRSHFSFKDSFQDSFLARNQHDLANVMVYKFFKALVLLALAGTLQR